MWDDLYAQDPGGGKVGDIYIDYNPAEDPDKVKFRWEALTFNGGQSCNFSASLFRNGDIRFEYGSGNTGLTVTVGVSAGNGIDYTIIENYDGEPNLYNANSVHLTFVASGGVALPLGVSLAAADGCFQGEPNETGIYNGIIEVTDSSNPPVTRRRNFTYYVVISENPVPPPAHPD